jgi:alpha-amylase/alpha-mannosidase (GH57 family)
MKYVCIHGHFYQPPRENPFLEAVEVQDSAEPYHDWNERITAECYAPNAQSRLLDESQRIVRLVNNYGQISFNFGPTLLLWMESKAPNVLVDIQTADQYSRGRFGGHGSAIAQAYNHMILPLANTRDKATQVKWGIADFEKRFGRKPEGMWLPETAVDTASLEALASEGVKFTILAPRQAGKVRGENEKQWRDVTGEKIDPRRPYKVALPSGKQIAVFFYDGRISQGVAFEGLLDDGKRFADRLRSGFGDTQDAPQLVHIATDGESYGHHHTHGEMALTYALNDIERSGDVKLTNYAEYLELFPPKEFVEIVENTSWSCIHGIERWRSNCGCNASQRAGWTQAWREPLRNALDALRDELAMLFELHAKVLLRDPWRARDEYIRVILDRSDENVDKFLLEHAGRELNSSEVVRALNLLEMQRHAMLMYTSCGWFFDEISGLESVQVLQYAGRAIQLAREILDDSSLEERFVARLSAAKSNLAEHRDAGNIYEKWVRTAAVKLETVAGHYAVSSLFENYGDQTEIYCYQVDRQEYTHEAEGRSRLAIGRGVFTSRITRESKPLSFAVLYLGDHNIAGGVRVFQDPALFKQLCESLTSSFERADTAAVIRAIDDQFRELTFSLRTLFRDEQRRIIKLVLQDRQNAVSASFQGVYENHASLIRFLNALDMPVPPAFLAATNIALNDQLRKALEQPVIDLEAVKSSLREAEASRATLNATALEFILRKRIEDSAHAFAAKPDSCDALKNLHLLLDLSSQLPFRVNLSEVQNVSFRPLIDAATHLNGNGNGNGNGNSGLRRDEIVAVMERLQIHNPELK